MNVETVAQEVVAEVKEVATKVDAITGEVVKEIVKAATVAITDAEKLAVREMENVFLKATIELQSIQKRADEQKKIVTDAQTKFPALIESYFKKYTLKTEEYVFDAAKLLFQKR